MAQNPPNTIGEKIKAVVKEQGRSVSWLAGQLNCHRVNIYDIYERQNIDTELLLRISVALRYNFFAFYTEIFQGKVNDVK
ncbi:MAG: XRE family transcriptional regulator [Bacteroidales bacterium]|nr:XRE family transcriptional regulator [Bacteroidales bacterium]